MEIELPNEGCNVITSTGFTNYNGSIRRNYIIFGARAFLTSENTSSVGQNYTGECISTGDLVYKPELEVYFNVLSIFIFLFILFVAFRLMLYRFWRKV